MVFKIYRILTQLHSLLKSGKPELLQMNVINVAECTRYRMAIHVQLVRTLHSQANEWLFMETRAFRIKFSLYLRAVLLLMIQL